MRKTNQPLGLWLTAAADEKDLDAPQRKPRPREWRRARTAIARPARSAVVGWPAPKKIARCARTASPPRRRREPPGCGSRRRARDLDKTPRVTVARRRRRSAPFASAAFVRSFVRSLPPSSRRRLSAPRPRAWFVRRPSSPRRLSATRRPWRRPSAWRG